MILTTVFIGIMMLGVVLVMLQALRGPTIYDRILAVNALGTKTVILIMLLGHMLGDATYFDIALVYALVNFVTVIAFLKYFKYGELGRG